VPGRAPLLRQVYLRARPGTGVLRGARCSITRRLLPANAPIRNVPRCAAALGALRSDGAKRNVGPLSYGHRPSATARSRHCGTVGGHPTSVSTGALQIVRELPQKRSDSHDHLGSLGRTEGF
jgi:hypothetical protein